MLCQNYNWPYSPLKGKYKKSVVGLKCVMCGERGTVELFMSKFTISREVSIWLREKQGRKKG